MENKKENKVLKFLGSLDIYVASIIMLVLLGITVVNVFMRYVMRSPITWVDELQLFLFLWIVYLSAGAAFRHSSHVAIEIIVDSLKGNAKKAAEIFAFLCSLLIMIYLIYQSNRYYMQLVSTNKIATLLRVSYKYVYGVVPIGNVLMLVSMVVYYLREIFGLSLGKEPEEEEEVYD